MEGVVSAGVLMLRKQLVEAQDMAASAVQTALETSDRLQHALAEEARVKALNSDLVARNALLELQVEKMRRAAHGASSERSRRLIDQLELVYEELEASATEDEIAARAAAAKTTRIESFERKRAPRRVFPDDVPTERVVIASPKSCSCCGSDRLTKLGETVTRTFEKIPARHKVIETVRERFSCRDCETIMQPPAPFHVTPRGMFGPHFLASLVFEKYGMHNPLNRQRDRYAQEGITLSLSTLADNVGAVVSAIRPLFLLLEAHVLAGGRLHADDTTVPRLAKYKTDIARMWTYVRDDTPFAGGAPPAALFYYSRDRKGEHARAHLANWRGVLQADNFAGYNALFKPAGPEAPSIHASCWAHGRRYLFELADIATQMKRKPGKTPLVSPLAAQAVRRIDLIFAVERAINGKTADERLAVRKDVSAPLVKELELWMRETRRTLSRHDAVGKAINYMLNDWAGFTAFLDDGRICLTNNAAERALRAIALGRKAWLFVGSDRGGERAAVMYSLIASAKLNDVDPLAWLTDVLSRIADIPQNRLHELLPWYWKQMRELPAIGLAA
jgi:transposase